MYKRVLTIQDISCVGQCSLTVALPILSACGLETAILPSAVLSTHTCGFSGYTFRDLTEDMPPICKHWEKEGIKFSAIYTGYLGSTRQIEYVKDVFSATLEEGGITVVDPAMADNGKLYPAFDAEYVEEMKKLAFSADVVLPNVTEACLLTGTQYRSEYDEKYVDDLLESMKRAGAKLIVLTGVGYDVAHTGVVVYDGEKKYYCHEKISEGCHGTGDVFASAFVGAYVAGKDAYTSAKIAADYVVDCIKYTAGDEKHKYGVKFEPLLGTLSSKING